MAGSQRSWWSSWGPGVWALAAGLLLAADASAQNFLVNGDFSAALGRSSWLETGTWIPEDWEGAAGSGALRITNSFPGESVVLGRQCVAIEGGKRYAVSGSLRAAPAQFSGSTTAALTIAWWDQGSCYSGDVVGAVMGFIASQTGGWERLGPTVVQAPAGAAGADVRLQVFKGAGAGSFSADFDGLLLELPEPGAGAGGLAAAGVLLALARRRSRATATATSSTPPCRDGRPSRRTNRPR
jgi:hypothetical protein